MRISKKSLFVLCAYFFDFGVASAHEAYVLERDYFWTELQGPFSSHALDALRNPHNIHITAIIVVSVFALLVLNFFLRESSFGRSVHGAIERLSSVGPVLVRMAIAVAFFFSASSWSFLGPELEMRAMPFAWAIRLTLYLISLLIALGLFTEFAAFAALVVFTIGFFVFGSYLFTYLNYCGEILVLFLFGSRKWSLDRLLFGPRSFLKGVEKYGTSIVRVSYGAALIYAGIAVKFLHPNLTIRVINEWNLTRFYWLFPQDPLLVTLGAGIAEVVIGLFIIFGFEMRLTVFISLIYITMSLFYFRELVWPHLMLYGISLNLLVQPEIFTIDHFLFSKKRRRLWSRPFQPHVK